MTESGATLILSKCNRLQNDHEILVEIDGVRQYDNTTGDKKGAASAPF
jgi:hypothetical protein